MEINASEVMADAIQNTQSIANFTQHKWGHEMSSREVSKEVKDSKGGTGNTGKYKVNLANGFEHELRTLTRPISRAYHDHLRMTIQWRDGRMLTNTRLIDYMAVMTAHETDLNTAKAALEPKLAALIQHAIVRNAGMCDISDYPTSAELLSKYSFEWDDFEPLATADCFGQLPDGLEGRFSDTFNQKVRDRMEAGVMDVCKRIHKLTSEFSVVLEREKPKFFQGTLDNIAQLTDTLALLNDLVSSKDITDLCTALRGATGYSAEDLRLHEQARHSVRAYNSASVIALASVLGYDNPTTEPESVPVDDELLQIHVPELPSEGKASVTTAGETPPAPVVHEPEKVEEEFGDMSTFDLSSPAPAPKPADKPKTPLEEVAEMDESELVGGGDTEDGDDVLDWLNDL